MNKIDLLKMVEQLKEKSYELGCWTSIWESTPGGVGKSTEELQKFTDEVDSLFETIMALGE